MSTQHKTHSLRAKPGMSIRMLADYMAASEQSRRTLLRNSKFQPKAPVIQHIDAQESISDHLSSPDYTDDHLASRIEILRSGLQGSDFEIQVAENNADYLERYQQIGITIPSRVQDIGKGGKLDPLEIEGFTLSVRPHLMLRRVNRRNTPKLGIGFFRYSKGRAVSPEVACWQSAIAFGFLKTKLEQGLSEVDPEKEMCCVFDVWSGATYPAPTNAVYRFNEVRAACAGIAHQWAQIQPPPDAVY